MTNTPITIDQDFLKKTIDQAVENTVANIVNNLAQDSTWLQKIEGTINQTVAHRVMSALSNVDVSVLVNQRVDEQLGSVTNRVFRGIQDTAEHCELTVLDKNVVVENTLTAKNIEAVESLRVGDLIVAGGINTDNHSWQSLTNKITDDVFSKLAEQWRAELIEQVGQEIKKHGISFDNVKLEDEFLISGGRLASTVKESNLQTVGVLKQLSVQGPVDLNGTLTVTPKRIGVNTAEPEMALSVWDEDVAIIAGKYKNKQGYIGTSRASALAIGVNREPAIEIDLDGLTAIKKLRVGVHRIQHATEIPNWAGTKGDVVFNADPTETNNVFAWQCLGGHRWKIIRSVQ